MAYRTYQHVNMHTSASAGMWAKARVSIDEDRVSSFVLRCAPYLFTQVSNYVVRCMKGGDKVPSRALGEVEVEE